MRPLLSDYYFVGVMIAVAMLQNGQLPAFLNNEILSDLLSSRNCSNPCIYQVQRGLEMLGMLSVLIAGLLAEAWSSTKSDCAEVVAYFKAKVF